LFDGITSNEPVFIVGAPRSGTSLTRDLLRLCDGLYIPPDETQFVPALIRQARGGASPDALARLLDGSAFAEHMRRRKLWPPLCELRALMTASDVSTLLPRLMAALAMCEGGTVPSQWGDKTPIYIFELDLLLGLYPKAKVVVVVRDPRNVVASMQRAWGRSTIRSAVEWRDAARIAIKARQELDADTFYLVRYEDLTTDPQGEMARIAAWLGITFDSKRLEQYKGEERWGRAAGHAGVQRDQGDAYREQLSSSQIACVERISIGEMRSFGYAPTVERDPYVPSRLTLRVMKLIDAYATVRHYAKDRGFVAGLAYKWRQLRIASMTRRA
jgi:hypothetical protein